MDHTTTVAWLLEHGGPAIRYRTLTELCRGASQEDIARAAEELCASPLVQTWLARFQRDDRFDKLHGSAPTTFENVIGKLAQLGCRAGMPALDAATAYFRRWLAEECPEGWSWRPFQQKLVGGLLAAAGYGQDPVVRRYLKRRLENLYAFTSRKDWDLYVDRSQYKSIPKGFKDAPLVNPALHPNGDQLFPLIYDLHALARYPDSLREADTQTKIDSVVDYVLDPRYQALSDGYGLMQAEPRHYYAIGWSVHLDGYPRPDALPKRPYLFVQRVVLMAHFCTARAHPWFQASLAHLEGFRTPRGTYLFPRAYLPELSVGYWVAGAHMGLQENRRPRLALELESTFWMAQIKREA